MLFLFWVIVMLQQGEHILFDTTIPSLGDNKITLHILKQDKINKCVMAKLSNKHSKKD